MRVLTLCFLVFSIGLLALRVYGLPSGFENGGLERGAYGGANAYGYGNEVNEEKDDKGDKKDKKKSSSSSSSSSESKSKKKSSSSSSSESKSKDHDHDHSEECPKPEPCKSCNQTVECTTPKPETCPPQKDPERTEYDCPVKKSKYKIPIFVANGVKTALAPGSFPGSNKIDSEIKALCDCDSGSVQFYKYTQGTNPKWISNAKDNTNTLPYYLDTDFSCKDLCIRDKDGKLWVPETSSETEVWIAPICTSETDCAHYAGIGDGRLKKVTDSSITYGNGGNSGGIACDVNNNVDGAPNVNGDGSSKCMKVAGVSCTGCEPLKWGSGYPKCYKDPTFNYAS